MPGPYSTDLRVRVIEAVEAGASRREAAERFEIGPSSAITWLQRWGATGSAAGKPTGRSRSPLEKHATWLLALIAEQPDRTLDEVVAAMHKHRIAGSRTATWRLFARHEISCKRKRCASASKLALMQPGRANVRFDNSISLTPRRWSSTRQRPAQTW
jgi:transposase